MSTTESKFEPRRVYFTAEQVSQGEHEAEVQSIEAYAEGMSDDFLKMNFQSLEEMPEGYGLYILPVGKTEEVEGESKRVINSIVLAFVPDPSYVASQRPDYIRDAVLDKFATKLGNASRPRDDGSHATLPFRLEEFLDNRKTDHGAKAFNQLAKTYVKALKKMGLSNMDAKVLREVLSSKSSAESYYPKIAQAQWEALLGKMIAEANKEGLATTLLEHWKGTRENAAAAGEDAEIDLGKLDSFLSAGEPEPQDAPAEQEETANA